jgi:hypothetical protein
MISSPFYQPYPVQFPNISLRNHPANGKDDSPAATIQGSRKSPSIEGRRIGRVEVDNGGFKGFIQGWVTGL